MENSIHTALSLTAFSFPHNLSDQPRCEIIETAGRKVSEKPLPNGVPAVGHSLNGETARRNSNRRPGGGDSSGRGDLKGSRIEDRGVTD